MSRKLPLLLLTVLLAACTAEVPDVPLFDNGTWSPTLVAGLPVEDGPSGLRPGGPPPETTPENGDDSDIDRLAAAAFDDVQTYWRAVFPAVFDQEFTPVRQVVSYASDENGPTLCGVDTAGLVNAFYCSGVDLVAWDRAELLPDLDRQFGPLAVVTVVAHELGHAVQFRLDDGVAGAPTIVKEQQADCYTGAFFRAVAEGRSARLRVTTGDGLNQVLATMFAIRDSAGQSFEADGAHGNAFDRVAAFQMGFGEGPARCRRIDTAEVNRRITQQSASQDDAPDAQGADLPLEDPVFADLEATLREAFTPLGTAEISASPMRCAGPPASAVVRYCQNRRTVVVDVPELARIGASPENGGMGDFAALAVVASRFSLSVQHRAGLELEGMLAAQRSACLTGAWAARIRAGEQRRLQLSPGDLDEAVAEMLVEDSLIAADVNGIGVPSGFARVKAFRDGFSSGIRDACASQYR